MHGLPLYHRHREVMEKTVIPNSGLPADSQTFSRNTHHGQQGSQADNDLKSQSGRKWQEMAAIGFPRIRSEIPHEGHKNQVGKVTPATPTLGVSRVFESFEMGSQGRLWGSALS